MRVLTMLLLTLTCIAGCTQAPGAEKIVVNNGHLRVVSITDHEGMTIIEFHDDEHKITCFSRRGSGISCLPDQPSSSSVPQ